MIDDSDGDTFWLISLFTEGPWGWIFLVLAVVLWFVASSNRADCAKMTCPPGQVARVLDHECLCAGTARP